MNRMDEEITLAEAVDYSKMGISTIDFSKIDSICDARRVPITRRQYNKMMEEGCLVGLSEGSYTAICEAFVDYCYDDLRGDI